MSISRQFDSFKLNVLLHPRRQAAARWFQETRRWLGGKPHTVSVFLQIDDPYSYLLSYYLPGIAGRYAIQVRLYLSEARGDEYQPEPEKLAEYAICDCARLAGELGIPFLDKGSNPPTEHRAALMDSVAAHAGADVERYHDELRQALAAYWRGDSIAVKRLLSATESGGLARQVVSESQQLQLKLGHYNSAMAHYAGEWFWGVDRLPYLLDRLDELGIAREISPDPLLISIKQSTSVSLPIRPPAAAQNLPPIELYFSFRSPYSYLALQRCFDIADAFGIELKLRPVLPMVMRGMSVPRDKQIYIAKDANREARRHRVPFMRFCDPLGPGVERCLAVFFYAEAEHRARDFALDASTAIWADGIDVATDKGLRTVTGRTGLFWPDVIETLKSDYWRDAVAANGESLFDRGGWGVPSITMDELLIWGQDRDWMLVRHIEELCDAGDGIIV